MPLPLLPIALSAGGLLGGFLGGKGRQPIDAKTLALLFGPNALAGDTQTLFQTLAASPMFQQIMSEASAAGTSAGNATRANFARAGLSSSGVGALGGAVSRGFGQNLILGARANLWNTALNAASANLANRMGLWGQSQLAFQGTPTMAQSFGAGLTSAAGTGLSAFINRQPRATAPAATATDPRLAFAAAPATSVITAPMRRIGGPTASNPFENRLNLAYAQ